MSTETLLTPDPSNQFNPLPSHCESYRIPAAKSDGIFDPAADPQRTVEALQEMFTNPDDWRIFSEAALDQVANVTWYQCYQPL